MNINNPNKSNFPAKKNISGEVTITAIESQKKNTNRFSVFGDEEFLTGISMDTFIHFNLKKGDVVDNRYLQNIINYEYSVSIKSYLLDLLARRDHASYELKVKAKKKGYPEDLVQSIIDELEKKGYLNNLTFAKKFVRDKFEFNKWGVHKIRAELLKKKIPEKDIVIALDELEKEKIEETVTILIQKNKKKFLRVDESKRKKKIFDFLLRKGYDSNTILTQMPILLGLIKK